MSQRLFSGRGYGGGSPGPQSASLEKDPAVRDDLALSVVRTGQLCRVRLPVSARCAYWLAIGLGLQARERPSTAPDGIRRMIDLLGEASHNDPVLDNGGPHRVLALVLMRVPGWPIGPPAAPASLPTHRLSRMMMLAAVFASLSCVIGLYLSYYLSIASGAAIVLTATVFFLLAFGWKKLRDS